MRSASSSAPRYPEGMDADLRMHAERTPNPDSIKWVLGRQIVEGGLTVHFDRAPPEEVSPLAARLFAIDGVKAVRDSVDAYHGG